MKILLYLSLLISTFAYSSDMTQKYLELTKSSEINLNKLNQYKILIIPGVLAESFLSKSNNFLKFNLVFEDGFTDQINFLEKNHLDYEFLSLETENSPESNAKVIIQKILDADRPVLIYSHSKGGLDTLEAINERPDLLNKIKGWASIQSPFWGSPIASGFNNNFVLRDTATRLFELMGGNQKGMSSLTIEDRTSYMDSIEIKNLISKINSKINFINYGSVKKNTFGYDSSLELFRNYSDKVSGPNDGVVPISSALMFKHGFNIDYIIENDVDHLMSMTKFYLLQLQYDREQHTKAVLELISK